MSESPDAIRPRMGYWHLWTDPEGLSRQSWCELTEFEQASMGGAAPQWNDAMARGEASVIFSVLPIGWIGDWHQNPKPQWIVPLKGRWWVESMDGHRVEMGPGELSFGEDQGCMARQGGGVGHRSGTLGDEPAHLMVVQLHVAPVPSACHWR